MRFSGQEKFFIKTNSSVRRELQTGLGCCVDKHMACMLRLHAGTLQIKGGKGAGKKYRGMEEFTGSKERSTQSQQQQAAVLEIAVDKKQSTSCFTTCLIYITVDLKQDVLPFQKKVYKLPKYSSVLMMQVQQSGLFLEKVMGSQSAISHSVTTQHLTSRKKVAISNYCIF